MQFLFRTIDALLPLVLCPLTESEAPQHFSSSETPATKDLKNSRGRNRLACIWLSTPWHSELTIPLWVRPQKLQPGGCVCRPNRVDSQMHTNRFLSGARAFPLNGISLFIYDLCDQGVSQSFGCRWEHTALVHLALGGKKLSHNSVQNQVNKQHFRAGSFLYFAIFTLISFTHWKRK